jgi:hypothetical protein
MLYVVDPSANPEFDGKAYVFEEIALEEAASKDFDFSDPKASKFERIVMAPGRFQPPHAGHGDMIRELVSFARQRKAKPVIVIVEGSALSEKNPLSGKSRKKFLQPVFRGIEIVLAKNPFLATEEFYKEGRVPVGIVAGSDRAASYKRLGEFYHIPDFQVKGLSRDPDAEDSSSFSASAVRSAVTDGKKDLFLTMMPRDMKSTAREQLWKELVKVLG